MHPSAPRSNPVNLCLCEQSSKYAYECNRLYLGADDQDSVCSLGLTGHPAHGAQLGYLSLLPEVHGHTEASVLLEELGQSHHRPLEGRALSRVHQ